LYILEVNATGDYEQTAKLKAGAPFSAVPPHQLVNGAGLTPKRVYEYRSGRLILGVMTAEGHFLPDVGSTVIKFGDYKYGPEAVPIWNLPGNFMRRDKLEERRRWLAEHLAEDPDYAKEKAKLDVAVEGKK
jgi:hypothetical protein